jgi:DNA-binding NarL/FixJ family response regulator
MRNLVKVLLVEDNEADAMYVARALRKARGIRFEVKQVSWLNSAIQAVELDRPDVVLLDLTLPDSQGVDTVVEFLKAAPTVPVIVMTGHDDDEAALNAVRMGAQDYLLKSELQARPFERALLYAIERKSADLVGKKLTYASIAQFQPSAKDSPAVAMLRNHVSQVSLMLADLEDYVHKNIPAHVEPISALMAKYDIKVVLREMRDILKVSEDRKRRVSEAAMKAVNSITDGTTRPSDRPAAEKNVLEVIERRERYGNGDH